MKLHKESKGTLIVAILFIAFVGAISIYYLHLWSLVIMIPLLIMLGLIFWFFRVPYRTILDHKENVVAPVDGKVVMIKEVFEDEVLKANCIQVSIFMSPEELFSIVTSKTRQRQDTSLVSSNSDLGWMSSYRLIRRSSVRLVTRPKAE